MRQVKTPLVLRNTGCNEWYTPPELVEAARTVLGSIDLDPASCEAANAVVGARRFYTLSQDGLSLEWFGRVWLNPPYGRGLIGRFCRKLAEELDSGHVSAAVVLVNNATDTEWFRVLSERSSALCFPHGRVTFWNMERAGRGRHSPTQGQCLLYYGGNPQRFIEVFSGIGYVVLPAAVQM